MAATTPMWFCAICPIEESPAEMISVTRAIVARGAYGPPRRAYNNNPYLPQGAQEASGPIEIAKAAREQVVAQRAPRLGTAWVSSQDE